MMVFSLSKQQFVDGLFVAGRACGFSIISAVLLNVHPAFGQRLLDGVLSIDTCTVEETEPVLSDISSEEISDSESLSPLDGLSPNAFQHPSVVEDRTANIDRSRSERQHSERFDEDQNLVEAEGWRIDANGNIELVGSQPRVAPFVPPSCAAQD
ncbi:MAG: hypothetical protein J7641_06105 [Cyanobacteria bacterium SID2]|nr:hypothetical protein [Cyanobacteria bacterium SID2]